MLDAANQLTLDELESCEREQQLADHADGRDQALADHAAWLSQSDGLAWVVLGELERKAGWTISIMRPFAGAIDDEGTDGVLVLLTHRHLGEVEIRVTGRGVDDCVPQILIETNKYVQKIVNADRRELERLRELEQLELRRRGSS